MQKLKYQRERLERADVLLLRKIIQTHLWSEEENERREELLYLFGPGHKCDILVPERDGLTRERLDPADVKLIRKLLQGEVWEWGEYDVWRDLFDIFAIPKLKVDAITLARGDE